MDNIETFPKHRMYRCAGTAPECIEGRCMYCSGGLSHCTTCGGFEASLPEDCPQRTLSTQEAQLVADGLLDYRRSQGGWTTWTRSAERHARALLDGGDSRGQ